MKTENASNVFGPYYAGGIRKGNIDWSMDLCLRKTRSGKSRDYRDVIVFEKPRFQNVFHAHENEKPAFSNSSDLKKRFQKLRFLDGLAWTVGLDSVSNSSGVVCFTMPKKL